MIARREPRHQGKLAFALLGALAVVVFGTLIGSYLGVHGVLKAPDTRAPRHGRDGAVCVSDQALARTLGRRTRGREA
jgi:hypothetical protein